MSTPVSGICIAVVGLRFGAAFVPLYQNHPDVGRVLLCDTNEQVLNEVGDRFGIAERFASIEQILGDETCDAVHLLTPVRTHAELSVAVLDAGKHCACAVPVSNRLDEVYAVVAAQERAGKNYMMMDTAVYTREFLRVKELHEAGDLGTLTFLRGAHIQNLEGYPDYWKGYPPMQYITHALSPLLSLTGKRAVKVACLGSGTLRSDLRGPDDNPFPTQSALFRLSDSDLAAEVTMSFFQMARPYTESFSVYGDRAGFEWQQSEQGDGLFFRLEDLRPGHWGRATTTQPLDAPYRPDLLPAPIADATRNGGHGGSHPHLVHEFIRSIVERRRPAVDVVTAANWTAAGICAHLSALRDGEMTPIPDFAAAASGDHRVTTG